MCWEVWDSDWALLLRLFLLWEGSYSRMLPTFPPTPPAKFLWLNSLSCPLAWNPPEFGSDELKCGAGCVRASFWLAFLVAEDSATFPSSPSTGTAGSLEAALVPSACGLQPGVHCRARGRLGWSEAASRVWKDQQVRSQWGWEEL